MESKDSIIRRSVLEEVVQRLREELPIIKRLEKYKIFRELELVGLYIPSSLDRDFLQIVYKARICDECIFPNLGKRFMDEVLISGEMLEKAQFIENDRLQLYVSFTDSPKTQLYINVYR